MARKWGHDEEERSAVAKKAQDSYAISRQAMEKIAALELRVLSAEREIAGLRAEHEGLVLQVEQSQRQPRPRRVA